MSQTPVPPPPQTQQKTSTTTAKKSQKELKNADGVNTDMRTKEQTIAFLTGKEYLNPSKTIDMQTLAHILLQLRNTAPRVPKPITDGIRAVALMWVHSRWLMRSPQ